MSSGILSLSLSSGNEIPILVGNETSISAVFQNNSEGLRLYNLNVYIDLPDGISLTSSGIPYTQKYTDTQGFSHYSFINLTDLVPAQAPYPLHLTLQCAKAFGDGEPIPFSYSFFGGIMRCEADTLPRGIHDMGNQVLAAQVTLPIKTTRYLAQLYTPQKVLKGAGTNANMQNYTQVQTAQCRLINNAAIETEIQLTVALDNCCRYIGSLTATGTDAGDIHTPVVSVTTQEDGSSTLLDFGLISLSKASDTLFSFQFAVWDKTEFNTGTYITHGTIKSIALRAESSFDIQTSTAWFSVMEIILTNYIGNPLTDVNSLLSLNFSCYTGQYHEVKNIWVSYTLPDGTAFLSSSLSASSEDYLDGLFLWNVALAPKNYSYGVNLSATVNAAYTRLLDSNQYPTSVAVSDPFVFYATIRGEVMGYGYIASDYADAYATIRTPSIFKDYMGGYYADGTPKVLRSLAPGDLAEFKLTYDADALQAVQKKISLSDFFPLSADPVNTISYVFGGMVPHSSGPADPHGVYFDYGDLSGNRTLTVQYKVPIAFLGAPTQNNNLLKLKGVNSFGVHYASREQVSINIGKPRLALQKNVSATTPLALQSQEVFQITLLLQNLQTAGDETDAFWFSLTDAFSEWFSYVEGSVTVSGAGKHQAPTVGANGISMIVEQLAPLQELRLVYQVRMLALLPPGLMLSPVAASTVPCAQKDPTSFRYTGLEQSAVVTLGSQEITFDASCKQAVFKVGSQIEYTVRVAVPQGTVACNVLLEAVLPEGAQRYTGLASFNGIAVTPIVGSSSISFAVQAAVDARSSERELLYRLTLQVVTAERIENAISTLQSTIFRLHYRQKDDAEQIVLQRVVEIDVFHPSYSLTLTVQNKLTGALIPNGTELFSAIPVLVKVSITNSSYITAVEGTVELPLALGFEYSAVASAMLCSVQYQVSRQVVAISIPRLDGGITAHAWLELKPKADAHAGYQLQLQAMATAYYSNTATGQHYGGETSDLFVGHIPARVSLVPSAYDKISEDTSYRASRPGEVIEIINYLSNNGGGCDSYSLRIEPVELGYSLFVDEVWQRSMLPLELFEETLDIMKELAPGKTRTIKLVTVIPLNSRLGRRYDFVVTATSNTSPFPKRTVVNIDPS